MRKFILLFLSVLFLSSCTGNLSPQPKPQIPDPFGEISPTLPPAGEAALESQRKTTNNNPMNTNKQPTGTPQAELPEDQPQQPVVPQGAIIKTSLGDIKVNLFTDKTPKTVANFAGLATGQKTWIDPQTGEEKNTPLYDDTIFHRVISDFMIQGGDPLGTGTGGPGYQFEDEIVDSLKFDKPYLLAMANSGPNTNGSQFFITLAETPWLNGKHTIFGEVVEGQAVVDKIGQVETAANDKPIENAVIQQIQIIVQ